MPRKTKDIVAIGTASSRDQDVHHDGLKNENKYPVDVDVGVPAPKADRLRARRKSRSMWARAAVVAGEVDEAAEVVRDVAAEGRGTGMWDAMNMW